jgi:predicted O-methyltransferase YrrM
MRIRSLLYPDCGLVTRWQAVPAIDLPGYIEESLPDDSSGYPISRALGHLLAQIVLGQSTRDVLEFGAGASSVVLARSLQLAGAGTLTSLEQSPEWCQGACRQVQLTGIDAHLEVTRPAFELRPWPCHGYATARRIVAQRGPYDLVLIDAPQWYFGRDGALPLAIEHLRPGALIVVDDAGRPQERWAIHRWLQTYPGLSLVSFDPEFGRNGVAVLQSDGSERVLSLRALTSAAMHAGVNWVVRTSRRLQAGAPMPKIDPAGTTVENAPGSLVSAET